MFKLVKTESKPLTREFVHEFHAMAGSPTERVADPRRITYLREKINAGLAIPFQWATATRKSDGVTFRVNGQHSSTVLAEFDEKTFPTDLTVHLDTYQVEYDTGLALLFRQFDDRKSGRSPSDVSGAYQGLYEPIKDVSRASAKIAVEGVVYWRKHVGGVGAPSGDDIYQLMGETGLHPFIQWIGEVFSIKTPELKRIPIVAAMYATFDANEEDARKFWADVARGGHDYDDNHPTTVLDAWLKDIKENDEKLSPGDFYQGCVYAYNAFFEEKPIKDIRHDLRKGLLTVKA